MLNNMKINEKIKKGQILRVLGFGLGGVLLLTLLFIATKSGHKKSIAPNKIDFTGVVDSQFSEADGESAYAAQQLDLEKLHKKNAQLEESVKKIQEQNEALLNKFSEKIMMELAQIRAENEVKKEKKPENNPVFASNEFVSGPRVLSDAFPQNPTALANRLKSTHIHSVSYPYRKRRAANFYRNPENYVPSGTFAKAVVLGGVDADASVDAQIKNNGVMLFKIINTGVLPNGKRSHLGGCFVTASAYGDISSERAYVQLNKISCVHEGKPIVDKDIIGWAFFGGKVGIKGIPLMRDSKVVAWAGISGALSGVAQAAQYAQSVQSFGAYGATSVVPSSSIAPFAGYGGASKAADQLSQYYIKRAEQYHPVIQVGAGNVVNIVFKEGFYLYDEEPQEKNKSYQETAQNNDPLIPKEVLAQINQAQLGEQLSSSGASE